MLDAKFINAFEKAATSLENIDENNEVIWNYVDADLTMDGFAEKLGENYMSWFNDMADQFKLNQAADRLEVLKTDYLGQ
tara:strand:+ start:318 stop:554 length:237 start_codon:yes stop_codon:yes gene_type:complete